MRMQRQFGNHGVKNRKTQKATAPRPPREAGEILAMPKSMAEPWTPYVMKVTGPIGILSDVHVPYHSEVAVAAAVGHLKEQGLSGLLLNGDIADFYAISRYMKDPAKRDFKGELEAVRGFLGWLRQEFPGIPIVYKTGNHEDRWDRYILQNAPELITLPGLQLKAALGLDELEIELIDSRQHAKFGKLSVLHGHEFGESVFSPVNPARGLFLRGKSSVLAGHNHQTSEHHENNMNGEPTACFSMGCLCDLQPAYRPFAYTKWNHGAAIVDIDEDGEFSVENFRIIDRKVR